MQELIVKIKKAMASQLGGGISWNMVALGFMAVGGLLYTAIIKSAYGAETLGLFGQTFGYYVAMAQLGVCGVHFSTLKYVSEFHEDSDKVAKIFGSAIFITSIIAFLISILTYVILAILNNIPNFFKAELVSYMFYVVPALFFFSINKVILNYLNGLSKMKEYAVFQSLRNIFIITSIVLFTIFKAPGKMLVLCFVISEFLLLLCIVAYSLKAHYINMKLDKDWIKEHIRYGFKIMPGSFVLELNARVDVFVLGVLTNDYITGIYLFALRYAEGFYQLLVVVRRNINPIIAQYIAQKDFPSLTKLKNDLIRYAKYLVPACAVLIVIGFAAVSLVIDETENFQATIPLIIVMVSITITSKHIIFGNILNQGGFPASEARLNIATLLTNATLNILLIPLWGMIGAAVATAISYIVFSIILTYSANNKLQYNLIKSKRRENE
ncbi:MAG: polysaccharide biosynthesis C-terminal domain-containing protein [Clostridiales bacterium]|nr:polysaccharide biosynthesis C-terminal domain-containing protein [Clostridiales bacterium]